MWIVFISLNIPGIIRGMSRKSKHIYWLMAYEYSPLESWINLHTFQDETPWDNAIHHIWRCIIFHPLYIGV